MTTLSSAAGNRRQFLKAAAGGATLTILPSGFLWGADAPSKGVSQNSIFAR